MSIAGRALSVFAILALMAPSVAMAERMERLRHVLPPSDQSLIGSLRTVNARDGDTFSDIARRYSIGFDEIRMANPGVDAWLPGEGTEVLIPGRFILPDAPREGIVVNVPEMRLYWFPPASQGSKREVVTYPVSVGRGEWQTPVAETTVVRKDLNPTWFPTANTRADYAARGEPLPASVPPGPDNPLGVHSLRLGLPAYLIHGTNRPYGIGMKVSRGCLRLYPEDIEQLFQEVAVGTRVRIVNQPYKAGWHLDHMYIEVHPEFPEPEDEQFDNLEPLIKVIQVAARNGPVREIDWDEVRRAAEERSGIPVRITRNIWVGAADLPAGEGKS